MIRSVAVALAVTTVGYVGMATLTGASGTMSQTEAVRLGVASLGVSMSLMLLAESGWDWWQVRRQPGLLSYLGAASIAVEVAILVAQLALLVVALVSADSPPGPPRLATTRLPPWLPLPEIATAPSLMLMVASMLRLQARRRILREWPK